MNSKNTVPISPIIPCLLLAMLAAAGLAGCSGGKTLQGSQRDAVLAYAEPAADNLFRGLNALNYTTFSRDFDDAMLKGLPEEAFKGSFQASVTAKIGKYVSRQVSSVSEISGNTLIVYNAKFEQEDNVTIRFSLETAAPHKVSG